MDMDTLIELEAKAWGEPNYLQKPEYYEYKAQILVQNNDKVKKQLKSFINLLGDGKARFFILYDTGNPDLGYQYLVPQEHSNFIKFLPKENGYIDIDLSQSDNEYKLIYLINLINTGKIAVVMKKIDGTFNDGHMICAFNREGFLEPDEIYSKGSITGNSYDNDNFIAYKIVINDYSTVFRGDDDQWNSLWNFPYIWSSTKNILDNDLYSYLYYVENKDSPYINQFILKYMQQTEIKYLGYTRYMKNYLGI